MQHYLLFTSPRASQGSHTGRYEQVATSGFRCLQYLSFVIFRFPMMRNFHATILLFSVIHFIFFHLANGIHMHALLISCSHLSVPFLRN